MALDRQSIEKKDFPIGRRGYDPDAVDAHLRALAEQVEELKRSSRRRSESLGAAATQQVRSIIDAAESSAAEIQRQAEADALDIRSQASDEAQASREEATSQVRDYLSNVAQSTTTMVQRLEAMQNELSSLFDALWTGSNRLNDDLQLLESNLDEVRDAVAPRRGFEPESVRAVASEPSVPQAPPPAPSSGPVAQAFAERPEPELEASKLEGDPLLEEHKKAAPDTAAVGALPAPEQVNGSEDAESARLVALNMAMDGKPRDETERYLAEHFNLSNRRELLDEVYAEFEG